MARTFGSRRRGPAAPPPLAPGAQLPPPRKRTGQLTAWDVLVRFRNVPYTDHSAGGIVGYVARVLAGSELDAVRAATAPALLAVVDRMTDHGTGLEAIAVPKDRPLHEPYPAGSPDAEPLWPRVTAPNWLAIADAHDVSTARLLAMARRVCADAGVIQPRDLDDLAAIVAAPLVDELHHRLTHDSPVGAFLQSKGGS